MTWLWVLGGILLLLLLLSRLRLGVGVSWEDEKAGVSLRMGVFHFAVYPPKPKKEKKAKQKKPKRKKEKPPKEEKPSPLARLAGNKEEAIALIRELLPLVRELLERFHRRLQVDRIRFSLICAGEDPADAAVFYGYANAAAGNLLPLLERWFIIKRKEIHISLDFEREKPQVSGQAEFSLTMGQLLTLGTFVLTRGVRFYRAHRKPAPPKNKKTTPQTKQPMKKAV